MIKLHFSAAFISHLTGILKKFVPTDRCERLIDSVHYGYTGLSSSISFWAKLPPSIIWKITKL